MFSVQNIMLKLIIRHQIVPGSDGIYGTLIRDVLFDNMMDHIDNFMLPQACRSIPMQ